MRSESTGGGARLTLALVHTTVLCENGYGMVDHDSESDWCGCKTIELVSSIILTGKSDLPTLLGSPGFSLDLATCPGVLLMHFFLLGKTKFNMTFGLSIIR